MPSNHQYYPACLLLALPHLLFPPCSPSVPPACHHAGVPRHDRHTPKAVARASVPVFGPARPPCGDRRFPLLRPLGTPTPSENSAGSPASPGNMERSQRPTPRQDDAFGGEMRSRRAHHLEEDASPLRRVCLYHDADLYSRTWQSAREELAKLPAAVHLRWLARSPLESQCMPFGQIQQVSNRRDQLSSESRRLPALRRVVGGQMPPSSPTRE